MELIAVAAIADNHVIGMNGELPWPSIPADKQQYRARINNDPVILGRRTFESMLNDLPGTVQIVLSRTNRDFNIETAYHATDVDDARTIIASLGVQRAYVIGGAEIYHLFHPFVNRMILSRIRGEFDGDTYFPDWNDKEWTLIGTASFERFTVEEWTRNQPISMD